MIGFQIRAIFVLKYTMQKYSNYLVNSPLCTQMCTGTFVVTWIVRLWTNGLFRMNFGYENNICKRPLLVSPFSDIACDPANAFDLSAFCLIRLSESFILSSNVIVLHSWETLHWLSAVDLCSCPPSPWSALHSFLALFVHLSANLIIVICNCR